MKFLNFGTKKSRKRPISTISSKVSFGKSSRFKAPSTGLKLKFEIFLRKNSVHIRNFLFIFLFFVAIYLFYYFFINSGLFKIRNIEVEGTKTYVNTNDLKSLLENKYYTQNIFFINTGEAKKSILNNFLGAKEVLVEKKFPNTLVATIIERYPIAIIQESNTGEKFLIDEDGYVLGNTGETFGGFPVIAYDNEINVGQFIEADIIPISLKIIGETQKNEVKLSSMSFSSNYIKFYIEGGSEIYIGKDKDIEKSVKSISAIVKSVALEGKKLKKIDLRYDKVIVLYE